MKEANISFSRPAVINLLSTFLQRFFLCISQRGMSYVLCLTQPSRFLPPSPRMVFLQQNLLVIKIVV
jgi:hypothetical protein